MKNNENDDNKFNNLSDSVGHKIWKILSQDIVDNNDIEQEYAHIITSITFINVINTYLSCVKDENGNDISFERYLRLLNNFNDNLSDKFTEVSE